MIYVDYIILLQGVHDYQLTIGSIGFVKMIMNVLDNIDLSTAR